MRKIFALILVLMFALSLVACDTKQPEKTSVAVVDPAPELDGDGVGDYEMPDVVYGDEENNQQEEMAPNQEVAQNEAENETNPSDELKVFKGIPAEIVVAVKKSDAYRYFLQGTCAQDNYVKGSATLRSSKRGESGYIIEYKIYSTKDGVPGEFKRVVNLSMNDVGIGYDTDIDWDNIEGPQKVY